ncbi:MAG: sporulation protein YqfD [Oscillospiraceae bacterium]|nr:sporulation protein YqfD [Oscillospiraceae bacterium]MDD3832380.1 sporulation protein YqfD [Oscillospiraceae bacterium]MDD4546803.1 sporulation protein YqfD [Oscillospiraceae bacterium]
MFLIYLLRWLFGWVRMEAEGGFPERLLNLAARDNIELWGVKRRGVILEACCPVRQYKRLRSPARKSGMRIHVTQRYGVPFTIRRYRSRAGLVVGLAAFYFVLQLFSQRIWVVEVRGNNKVDPEEILAVMQEFGVNEGADLSKLDVASLQLKALQKLPNLAWCAVNLQGSIAFIDVTERVPTPQLSDHQRPSNIKATRDGRIVSVEVYTGQSLVSKGDAVAKGMLLVSGVIDSKVGPIFRRSQARILASTARRLEVSVPLKETLLIPSGRTVFRPSLYLFTLKIPLYTNGKIEQKNKLTISKNMLNVNHIDLPVGFISHNYQLLEPGEVVRSEQEAQILAKKMLQDKKENELAGAEIVTTDEKGEIKNGCYVITGRYDCIENICMEEQLLVE